DDPVARLAREARTVAQLDHPGIVSVHAVRRLHGGGLTLVMQLVPGATLKESIQRHGPFGAARAEVILREVAQALAYAHARHVVHRDVKPENIFLDAISGHALLADFGIARSAEAESLTMTGTAIGTPFYMSPEQVDGRPVDGRSDLYSLGLVAWEMLTGLRPWDGESLYHVIYKQKHDDLPPIEATRRDVPRRLQYIVERMLQKEPGARWAGVDGLLAQLDRTILPTDFVQWQAALPERVARHHALAQLRPHGEPRADRTAATSAPTVQFSAAPDADSGGSRTTPGRASTAIADPEPTLLPIEPVAPSWAATEPSVEPELVTPARRSGFRTWIRRGLQGSVLAAAGAGIAAVALRSHFLPDALGLAGELGESTLLRSAPDTRLGVATPSSATRVPGAGMRAATAPVGVPPNDLIAIGAKHGCDIARAGDALCWGQNDALQLGDGSRLTTTDVPRHVAGVMTYVALGAGASHTCGVTLSGDVYCWGQNDEGQLGDGTTVGRSAPVRVAGRGTYRLVRGGAAHTCALDDGGGVSCWGENASGELGDGTQTAHPVPTRVRLPAGVPAVGIATGAHHSCALLGDDRVMCWGANADGQLGVSGLPRDSVPHEVPGVRARALGAGESHTCAVLRTGPVRCWGRNERGQLGLAQTADSAPGRLTVIPAREDVRTVVAGATRSCALTETGWIWCWGDGLASARERVTSLGRGPYVAIAASGDRSCALDASRVVECWATTQPIAGTSRGTRVVTR
ncbi:MAG: protein kinase, partial [Candidatus Eremiobacteraeota bacterium]|nr:protein kinase [Candidatus Eremiobacteraeota bacterium]